MCMKEIQGMYAVHLIYVELDLCTGSKCQVEMCTLQRILYTVN